RLHRHRLGDRVGLVSFLTLKNRALELLLSTHRAPRLLCAVMVVGGDLQAPCQDSGTHRVSRLAVAPVGQKGRSVPEADGRPRSNLDYRRFSPCRSLPGVHLRERLEVAPHSEAATDSGDSIAAIRPS